VLLLKPDVMWDVNPEFKFVIHGISDSDFTKDPETRKCGSGNSTHLCGALVIQRSTLQRLLALSITEVELFAATNNAQDDAHKTNCGDIGVSCKIAYDLRS
jgi:hypothetical protein